jgi:murein hydrolase activator
MIDRYLGQNLAAARPNPAWAISALFVFGAALLCVSQLVPQQRAAAQFVEEDRAALVRAKAQSVEAEARSAALAARADSVSDAADRARLQAASIAASIQAAEAGILAAEARLSLVQAKLGDQRAQLAQRQAPVLKLMGALQSLSRRPPTAVLAQPGSLADMVHVRIVLGDVMPEIEQRTKSLKVDLARTRALREDVKLAADVLKDEQLKLRDRRSALVRLEGQRRIQSRQLASSAALESDRAIAMGEEARDINDLLVSLAGDSAQRDRLAELPGPSLRPDIPGAAVASVDQATAPASGPPVYRLPVIGQLVRGFGEATPSGARSMGLTIRTRAGAQIIAPAQGRVVFSGPYRGYGNILIIDHADGWSSLITDLIANTIKVGDKVDQGEPVGRAGPDRPTITIELRRQGRAVDIAPLLG